MDAIGALNQALSQEILQNTRMVTSCSVMKQTADLQKTMTAQLFQSMGIGQNVDITA